MIDRLLTPFRNLGKRIVEVLGWLGIGDGVVDDGDNGDGKPETGNDNPPVNKHDAIIESGWGDLAAKSGTDNAATKKILECDC